MGIVIVVPEGKLSFNSSAQPTNIEDIFNQNLQKEQSANNLEDLERHKILRDFKENIWNIHHSEEQFLDEEEATQDDDSILIGKKTGDRLLCPITMVS